MSLNRFNNFQWEKLNRLSALVLGLMILYLCWKLASLFWWIVAPPKTIQFESVELGAKKIQPPPINNFTLFNEFTPSTAYKQEQNFELQGVILSSPHRLSSAVIKVNDTSERYRVGEMVDQTGYVLAEVRWDHVILRQNNGQTKDVRFKGIENGLYQPLLQDQARLDGSQQDRSSESNAAIGSAVQQMSQNREQYLQSMGVVENDGNGYEVTERTPLILRNKIGLKPGDRILSVNGQAVGGGHNDMQLLEQIKREGQASIQIKRGDQVMTVQQGLK